MTADQVNWDFEGKPDPFFGAGSTLSEKLLVYLSALVIPAFLAIRLFNARLNWSLFQIALAMLIAADVGGGVVANALNSDKRYYHHPDIVNETWAMRIARNPVIFTLLHVYPLLVGIFFGPDLVYGFGWYGLMVIAAMAVMAVPLYLRRPASFFMILLAFLINLQMIPPVEGFGWLMPLLFLKVIYGRLVQEEPYGP